jgi:hypothetical protein
MNSRTIFVLCSVALLCSDCEEAADAAIPTFAVEAGLVRVLVAPPELAGALCDGDAPDPTARRRRPASASGMRP